MTLIRIGIVLFLVPHFYSMLMPATRDRLKAQFGENAFKGIYALASFLGLGLIVWGYHAAWAAGEGTANYYDPPAWGRHVTMLFVLMAFILVGASHGKGHLRKILRNPMSLGVSLWAAGHLLANGRLIDVTIFGAFLVLGLLDIVLCTLRGKALDYVPSSRSDVIAVAAGMVLYVIFLFGFHPYVLGLPVVK